MCGGLSHNRTPVSSLSPPGPGTMGKERAGRFSEPKVREDQSIAMSSGLAELMKSQQPRKRPAQVQGSQYSREVEGAYALPTLAEEHSQLVGSLWCREGQFSFMCGPW